MLEHILSVNKESSDTTLITELAKKTASILLVTSVWQEGG